MEENLILVICTFPDRESSLKVSKFLIENKLAACVNIFPCESIFFWENKINEEKEYIAFIKTRKKLFETVKNEIGKMHPYSTPEIISFKIENINEKYFKWVLKETKKTKEGNI
jgi:periplasmic divalent cation tolerance protein